MRSGEREDGRPFTIVCLFECGGHRLENTSHVFGLEKAKRQADLLAGKGGTLKACVYDGQGKLVYEPKEPK